MVWAWSAYWVDFSTVTSGLQLAEYSISIIQFIEYINNDNIETKSEAYKKIMSKFLNSTKNNTNKRLSEYFISPVIIQDIIQYLCICKDKISELQNIINKELFI